MEKARKTRKLKVEPKLSNEAIEAIEHFFKGFPPKYFSRNLRNMIIDWVELLNGQPDYMNELFMQLNAFFPVLDLIEDEKKFDSDDYERNREDY